MAHEEFILTPISRVLEEAITALKLQPSVMQNVAIGEYIMQAIFLKMTGFQEQKCKLICWELATDDDSLRVDIYGGYSDFSVGECSDLKSKQAVFKKLQDQILKIQIDLSAKINNNYRNTIVENAKNIITQFYSNSRLLQQYSKEYAIFRDITDNFDGSYILMLADPTTKKYHLFDSGKDVKLGNIFKERMNIIYDEHIKRHRDRCAHNLLSYQSNIPTMTTMSSKTMCLNNYFVRFFVLILIDDMMRQVFDIYRQGKAKLCFL